MQAVILAAGKGLRLRPFTEHHPKPLLPIAGQPILDYTLNSLPEQIKEVIIVVGYLGEQIKEKYGSHWNGLPISYVEQSELLGTGDAITRARELLYSPFLVVNGDDLYTKRDLEQLVANPNSILAWQSTTPTTFGLKQDANGALLGFDSTSSLVNCGAYCLTAEFFSAPLFPITVHERTEYSLPHTLIELSTNVPVKVVKATGWLPIGTPEQMQFAENYYMKRKQNTA